MPSGFPESDEDHFHCILGVGNIRCTSEELDLASRALVTLVSGAESLLKPGEFSLVSSGAASQYFFSSCSWKCAASSLPVHFIWMTAHFVIRLSGGFHK